MIWLIFLISCLTLKPLNAQNAFEARLCTAPDKRTGTCIPVKLCQPMVHYLLQAPSITHEIADMLIRYRCDPTIQEIMVCCPNGPIIINATQKLETIEPKSCTTPHKRIGTCVPIKMCLPMIDYLQRVPSITQEISEMLNEFQCDLTQNDIMVCCPKEPIIINEVRKMFSRNVVQHRNIDLLPENCGELPGGNRIIGGNKTTLFEFPWMALLAYRSQNIVEFRCGGSIINSRYILTAAHCITQLQPLQLVFVRSGEYNISSSIDCQDYNNGLFQICASPVQDIAIEEVIPHPNYNRMALSNDIGLIRLVAPLNFSVENVKPICLPTDNDLLRADLTFRVLTVTGWGLTETGSRSADLLKGDFRISSQKYCQMMYARARLRLYNTQLCGGGTVDSCGGDSGGPLQGIESFIDEDRFVQYGIVSFGPRRCGNNGFPGVYTKIGPYLEWILDNLKP
ncbi:CLIP domain-containing serine protease 14D-like isoform X1 [Photinus pyralis]|uniref:CLIP domain-containing serine protease 14D-like isoform X1 n=2 Tax=Photinus pyralis TaxID=7054 RepID=UPI0012670CEE|nr:CLIP domain-containing serine protease 14D-like isoform X1 [Photinus pyralis]